MMNNIISSIKITISIFSLFFIMPSFLMHYAVSCIVPVFISAILLHYLATKRGRSLGILLNILIHFLLFANYFVIHKGINVEETYSKSFERMQTGSSITMVAFVLFIIYLIVVFSPGKKINIIEQEQVVQNTVSVPEKTKICPACSTPNYNNDNYCKKCGNKL